MTFLRTTLSVTSTIAPPLAAEIGYRLWSTLGPPELLHSRDRDVHERAVRTVIDVDGKPVSTYEWGEGTQTILLVHGWRSRASRFSGMVERLVATGYRVLAFDAPGHGETAGGTVTILDFIAAIRAVVARYGKPRAIVGHSFGALAAFVAVREGVPAGSLISIAGMYDFAQLVTTFGREARMSERSVAGLRRRIDARTFPTHVDPWRRFVAEVDPTDVRTPILIVADSDDPRVPLSNADRIAEAHTGSVTQLRTAGFGHNRVVNAPEVLDTVTRFVQIR